MSGSVIQNAVETAARFEEALTMPFDSWHYASPWRWMCSRNRFAGLVARGGWCDEA
jgi:hypothetical protein